MFCGLSKLVQLWNAILVLLNAKLGEEVIECRAVDDGGTEGTYRCLC